MAKNNLLCNLLGHRWKNGSCVRCYVQHDRHAWEMDQSMARCKVCGKATPLWDALQNEAHNGWSPVIDSGVDPHDLYMIAWSPDKYRPRDWEAAVTHLNDQKELAEIFAQRLSSLSQAKLVAARLTDPKSILYAYEKGEYRDALKEKMASIGQERMRGKSQRELAQIAENDVSRDNRLFALDRLEDQAAIERIANQSCNNRQLEDIRKTIALRVKAINKLNSQEAVERAFAGYSIGEEWKYEVYLPVFTAYLRRMASHYMPGLEVPCGEIALCVCRVANHSPGRAQWASEVSRLKGILNQYGQLLQPVRNQLRDRVSSYVVYPSAKTYGDGDDAFTVFGEGVNIGIDIDGGVNTGLDADEPWYD